VVLGIGVYEFAAVEVAFGGIAADVEIVVVVVVVCAGLAIVGVDSVVAGLAVVQIAGFDDLRVVLACRIALLSFAACVLIRLPLVVLDVSAAGLLFDLVTVILFPPPPRLGVQGSRLTLLPEPWGRLQHALFVEFAQISILVGSLCLSSRPI
jgi:hypothetical protein